MTTELETIPDGDVELTAGPSGSTPNLGLPYPVPADTVDVPRDIQALATKLDGTVYGGRLTNLPVLDVGVVGQIRAGRQLTVADFTALGLAQPIGLWNLSDLTNLGSDGRPLANKGAVTFAPGINGQAATAAQFTGSTAQALYIPDSGAADPFRISTGSWGCWFKTAKAGYGGLIGKYSTTAGSRSFFLQVSGMAGSPVISGISFDGFASAGDAIGVTNVLDDRWHFAVVTFDGTSHRLYVDGVLEAAVNASGVLYGTPTAALTIGALDGAAATVVNPHFGRVDEAFVTADVLSEDQVRALYCAKIPHTLGVVPSRVSLNVRRRKRGGTLAVGDFPSQPLRLHNFTGVTSTFFNDEGSNGVPLAVVSGGVISGMAAPDGRSDAAAGFIGSPYQGMAATDAGLPSGTAARSYGCWFKTTSTAVGAALVGWGTQPNGQVTLFINSTINASNGTDNIVGPYVVDGQWHHAVVVEDNAAGDGVKRKLYLDGRLVGGSTVLNAIALGGANRFRIGANPDGSFAFTGQIDGAFVCGQALTYEQVAALWAKGSQAMPPSPKNPGDHVEAMDATAVYAVFDTLDTQHTVDVGVAA